jgi:hypothetical protein
VIGLTVDSGYTVAAIFIVASAIVIVIILGYRIIRGESLIHRTRLGIFVERDRFEEPDELPEVHDEPKHD